MGEGYAYELKYDGTQVRAFKKGSQISLITKRGIDRTSDFPHIARELSQIEGDVVLVGEICYFEGGEGGEKSIFPITSAQKPLTELVVFDIVERGGYEARRGHIERLVAKSQSIRVSKRYSTFEEGWNEVKMGDLEGIVAKPLEAHFQLDLGVKMKNHTDKDVEIEAFERNTNGTLTLIGADGTRAVCYDKDSQEIVEAHANTFPEHKLYMTIENLTGTRRNPKFKKIEVK